MPPLRSYQAFLCVVLLGGAGRQATAQSVVDQTAEAIRRRVEAAAETGLVLPDSEALRAHTALPAFYTRRQFRPAWSGAGGPLPLVDELLGAIRASDADGLDPSFYHLDALAGTLAQARSRRPLSAAVLADLDLLATDAFMLFGSHLLSGHVNPESVAPEWTANRRGTDFAAVLDSALSRGAVRQALLAQRPPQRGYAGLLAALAEYRRIAAAGGWITVPVGPALRRGADDPRVVLLRRRLAASGDLRGDTVSSAFDADVDAALRQFQARHGIGADGELGAATLSALNVPVEERIRQIALNLERWRWLPQDMGRRHIRVNIASFDLAVMEDDEPVLTMRVVVGRRYRKTPLFSGAMTYLVLSPFWLVPHTLAVQDQLPLIKSDSTYFTRLGMRVFVGWGADATEVDPSSVDWSAVTPAAFPYRLRQDPGPANALGRVKFMFPNAFSVYLHDTPAREYFSRVRRDFSSGCIRVENALALARYLLRDDPRWAGDQLDQALATGVERTVPFREPVPVHLLYWTAWTDAQGIAQFRPDIYGRDTVLDQALRAPPPVAP